MSTTSKYNFIFLLPISITDLSIPFDQFEIPETESKEYYSYNQYMELPGNKAFYTPSGSHALLETNITSIFDLAEKFPQYLAYVAPHIVIKEGVDTTAWADENQANYLWILPTDRQLAYCYNKFQEVSLL